VRVDGRQVSIVDFTDTLVGPFGFVAGHTAQGLVMEDHHLQSSQIGCRDIDWVQDINVVEAGAREVLLGGA
jgi:hypothetical protein